MPVSDVTSDIDTILNEEHELIMAGQKSIADGIRDAGDRVKNEVL
jgi:multiple sugar transport system substrate-binding protein